MKRRLTTIWVLGAVFALIIGVIPAFGAVSGVAPVGSDPGVEPGYPSRVPNDLLFVDAALPSIIPAPVSVELEQLTSEDDEWFFVFDEKQGLTLASDLATDTATIPGNTTVDSHFVHFDNVYVGSGSDGWNRAVGEITFECSIIGLITSDARLNATDELLGVATTAYPYELVNRGLEFRSYQDIISVSADGLTLTVDFQAQEKMDQMRVVTEVCNEPPVADPNGPYVGVVDVGIAFDGTGSFDPDGDDLTYSWDFDDLATGSGVTPTHTYINSGMYDVCLTVTDPYGAEDTACTTAVVGDPSEGFVTGGGWIDSPAGAYKADPLMTGKATFGFISKYKKGATVPTGNTEFQFHAGDLNFHSSSYDWLVVTGTPTAKFKGTGTINGEGAYKFMIWAGDGEPDTFRIKIWEEIDGTEYVVYDNGTAQPISAGNIVIHTKK